MKKSVPVSNDFCPQTLFLYGTYKDDGTPNFGLFCWFSYYWDGECGVMACIGGEKLTKDRIRATKVFSANLVTEDLLPLADYFGNKEGYKGDKLHPSVQVENGHVLDVPVLAKSPWVFELEVNRSIELDDGEVLLCKIRNVLADELLSDDAESVLERQREGHAACIASIEQRIKTIRPVHTACAVYFSWDGNVIGPWGEPMKKLEGY